MSASINSSDRSTRASSPLDAIVIGGSAGALEALAVILPALPADFPLPVLLVIHIPPNKPSYLVEVLGRSTQLSVKEAEDKEPLCAGTLYVAPPSYHLLVERQRILSLSVDEPIHFSRPSIDVLFESAAEAYGAALLGLLLTGANADGARGIARIKEAGGVTMVQAPQTSSSPEMPEAALRLTRVDHVLPPLELGVLLSALGRGERAQGEAR